MGPTARIGILYGVSQFPNCRRPNLLFRPTPLLRPASALGESLASTLIVLSIWKTTARSSPSRSRPPLRPKFDVPEVSRKRCGTLAPVYALPGTCVAPSDGGAFVAPV